jgi:hypothetical protein
MKLTALIFFTFYILSISVAQITWGPEFKLKADESLPEVIGESESILYVTKIKSAAFANDEFFVQKFDSKTLNSAGISMLLPKDALISEGAYNSKPEYEKTILLNDRLVMFLTAFDKSRDQNIAYVQRFNESDDPLDMIKLDKITNVQKFNRGSFDLILSPSKSKILLVQTMPFRKHQNEEFGYRLFDKDFKMIWSKGFKMPYFDKNFGIQKYLLDDNEDVIMLAKIDKEPAEKEKGQSDYYFSIIEYTPRKNESVEQYDVKLPGKYITDISIELNNKDEILCMGFYANDAKNGIQGTFFIRIDRNTKSMKSVAVKPFERELMLEFMEERNLNRGRGLSGFNIDKVILKEDGGAFVVSEQYYMREICSRDARGFFYCNYYYYYNSIIVINIDPEGNIIWNSIIPKFQNSINDNGYYLSYALGVSKTNLNFVYLDHPKNLGITDPKYFKVMNNANKAIPMLVTLSHDGSYTKVPLFTENELPAIIRPKFNRQINDSTLVLMGITGNNRFRLAKLKF